MWAEFLAWAEGLVRDLNGGIGESGITLWDSPELPKPESYKGTLLTVQVTSAHPNVSSKQRKIIYSGGSWDRIGGTNGPKVLIHTGEKTIAPFVCIHGTYLTW